MANFNQYEAKAKTWATAHLVAAAIICLIVGAVIGALIF